MISCHLECSFPGQPHPAGLVAIRFYDSRRFWSKLNCRCSIVNFVSFSNHEFCIRSVTSRIQAIGSLRNGLFVAHFVEAHWI